MSVDDDNSKTEEEGMPASLDDDYVNMNADENGELRDITKI